MSKLQTRLGYGKTAVVEMDTFTRIIKGEFWDFEEVRYDRPSAYSNSFAYVGVATQGSSILEPVWSCIRRTYDENGKVVRDQFRQNIAWSDRFTGWN